MDSIKYEKMHNNVLEEIVWQYRECLDKRQVDNYFNFGDTSFLPINLSDLTKGMRND